MYLDSETILDFYTHKNTKILCLIKFNPKSGKFKNSCRCLSQEHWKAFDKELEKFVNTVDDWNSEKCLKFVIKPAIQVNVKKSNKKFDNIYKCFGSSDDDCDKENDITDAVDINFVLECLFDFQLDAAFASFTECEENERNVPNCISPSLDLLQTNNSTNSPKSTNKILEAKSLLTETTPPCSSAAINKSSISNCSNNSNDSDFLKEYIIETDSKVESHLNESQSSIDSSRSRPRGFKDIHVDKEAAKNASTRNGEGVESKEQYKIFQKRKQEEVVQTENAVQSLQSKSEKHFKNLNEKLTVKLKKYDHDQTKISEKRLEISDIIPAKTKEENISKLNTKDQQSSTHEKDCVTKTNIALSIKKSKKFSKPNPSRSDNEGDDNELDQNIDLQKSNENVSHLKAFLSHEIVDKKASSEEVLKSLRRSERSPSKPKRLIEEQQINIKRSKKHKSLLNNRELFGTDDEDDAYFENNVHRNINHKKSKTIKSSIESWSSSSSFRKKYKKDKQGNKCEHEKRCLGQWLSKKKSSDKEATKSSKSPTKTPKVKISTTKSEAQKVDDNPSTSTPISVELPSKEEMKLMRNKNKLIFTENEKVRAELDKMITSPPKEIEIRDLQNIPVGDILETFVSYKSELDEIYKNNRKKDYIKGHDGINHCFVIKLLHQSIQLKMLEKLTEVYSDSTTSTEVTLFANALLPEWIIRVYMKKFSFTRQEAIDQIKRQEEYQLHMEEQSDNAFMFD